MHLIVPIYSIIVTLTSSFVCIWLKAMKLTTKMKSFLTAPMICLNQIAKNDQRHQKPLYDKGIFEKALWQIL